VTGWRTWAPVTVRTWRSLYGFFICDQITKYSLAIRSITSLILRTGKLQVALLNDALKSAAKLLP
jgi:hypothetical protein